MDKKGKKPFITKEGLFIVGVGVCAIICFACILSAVIDVFKTVSFKDIIDDSPIGDVASQFGDIEENMEGVKKLFPSLEEDFDALNYDTAEVVSVKSGESFIAKVKGVEETIKLLDVSVLDEHKDKLARKLKNGDTVLLKYGETKLDNYDRVLAYVYFEDGKSVQDWLLENGYAK